VLVGTAPPVCLPSLRASFAQPPVRLGSATGRGAAYAGVESISLSSEHLLSVGRAVAESVRQTTTRTDTTP
jgi:hypothetical protein